MNVRRRVSILFLLSLFILGGFAGIAHASGSYDNGSPTGYHHLKLDITWNPFDLVPYGQTYVVWGYGLTNRIDFHGYISHAPGEVNQIYYGLKYCFLKSDRVDLSTAIGLRQFYLDRTDIFFPQLLYNFHLGSDYLIGGSFVNVQPLSINSGSLGISFDIALSIPLSPWLRLDVGLFKSTGGQVYPTYSVGLKPF